MSTNRPDVVVVVPVVAAANPRDGFRGAERGVEGGACMPFAHPRGLVAARGRRRRGRVCGTGGGEGGGDGGGIHQTPFVLMNLPDNGARSMNYVPRGFESERNRGSSPLIRRSAPSARRAHSTTRQVSPPFGERRFAVTSLCARGRSRFAREKLSFGESEDSSPSFSFSVRSVGRVMGGGELSEWKRVWDF